MKNWVDPEAKAEAERYDNPIPSRTLILETIEEKKTALSHADLVEIFEIADQKSIDALSHRLIAMVRDGQLMKDGFKFLLAEEQPEHEATVYINSKGFGTANITGHEDLLLRLVTKGGALHHWWASYELLPEDGGDEVILNKTLLVV